MWHPCVSLDCASSFSVARTPQQNEVTERMNMTLIKAAKTMLADSKISTTFWAEVVNTACYADEGFFVGYSLNSKTFRVFNSRTRIVEKNLHIRFSESTLNTVGSGPDWLFDIDALTRTMNYEPIVAGTQSNGFASTKESDNAAQARKKTEPVKNYILLPLWTADLPFSHDLKSSHDDLTLDQVIEDLQSATQTRNMSKNLEEHGENQIRSFYAMKDPKLVEASRRASTSPSYKKIVDQGYTLEEGIDYNEVVAPVARIKAIRLFLAYASFKEFVVYQMDVKSAFLYGKIEEEVYKFGFTEVKTASTPMETQKPLLKDEDGEEVDVHMYRSMIVPVHLYEIFTFQDMKSCWQMCAVLVTKSILASMDRKSTTRVVNLLAV
ncbi:retrovirus-related pol polyprotein from transposon TNT 1-94 [Tanacetum coccineum]